MGTIRYTWTLLFFAGAACLCSVSAGLPCAGRYYSPDRLVCVCNATYCDTVDVPTPLPEGQFVQYTTNMAGLRFEKTTGQFEEQQRSGGLRLTVDASRQFQTILGFGTAFTDAAGINVASVSSEAQENIMRSYFGSQGIELNLGRVPIGGCDFSTHPYSYNDLENDTALNSFSLTQEDHAYKIPLITRARELSDRGLKLTAAAWTAPVWMKTNHDWSGYGFLKEEFYELWASYHIKFLDEYKKEGVDIWILSTGNEPFNGVVPLAHFNSMGWLPDDQLRWVRDNLGPALRSSQHNNTKIITVDDQRLVLKVWAEHIQNSTEASEFISGIAVHWYTDRTIPPSILDDVHEKLPDKFILATEACNGATPWDQGATLGSWAHGEAYMQDIIENLNHWVVGWIDWNLALDTQGGPNWAENYVDAPIIVNATTDEFYKQPSFYALGHFSKFLPEGSTRVHLEGQSEGAAVQSVAFRTPEEATVVVLFNKGTDDEAVSIADPNRGHINLSVGGKSFQTIVYW